MNFPSSPIVNQTYSQGSRTWKWNGAAWALQPYTIQASDVPKLDASQITTGTLSSTLLPALTGDVSTTVGSNATVLATVNSNTGSFGDGAHIAVFTVNGKGLTTAASNVAIAISASQITSGAIDPARLPIYSGDVSTTSGSTTLTLATVNANPGTYGSYTAVPVITVDAKGRITAVSNAALGTAADYNIGTTGYSSVPTLGGINTWMGPQTFSQAAVLASSTALAFSNFSGGTASVVGPSNDNILTISQLGLANYRVVFTNSILMNNGAVAVMGNTTMVQASQLPALTGDVTSVAGSNSVILSTITAAGSFGSGALIPTFKIDAKGRVTTASNVTVTPDWSAITSIPAGLTSLAGLTGAGLIQATGTGVLAMQYVGVANSTDIPNLAGADGRYVGQGGSSMSGPLLLSGDPTTALGAATKQYVDNAVQGLSAKQSARVASAQNIALSGLQTIDGVALAVNDRVLVMGQTTSSQNGVYVASSGAWVRSADMDTWVEIVGAFIFVEQGTGYGATGWVCNSPEGGTLGTSPVAFVQFNGAGSYTASNGVTLVGQNIQLTGQALVLNNYSANGTLVYVGTGFASRQLVAPAAGLSITNPDGVAGNPTFALAGDLAALENLSTTGYAKRTGTSTWVTQTIPDSDLPSLQTGKTFTGQIVSTVATGTAPLAVASTTQVNNLNSQYLGGQPSSYYTNASNINAGTISASCLPPIINTQTFGGQSPAYYTNASNINAGTLPDVYLPAAQSGKTFTSAVSITAGVDSTSTTTGSLIIQGGVGISGALNASTKSFSIHHPTKPGMTLRHGSLEGPEFGVYVRGRLTDDGIIDLPDYWIGLVDPQTITVQLTPIGHQQRLHVERIENNRVHVRNETMFYRGIDCFYLVMAERKDVPGIVVESPAE